MPWTSSFQVPSSGSTDYGTLARPLQVGDNIWIFCIRSCLVDIHNYDEKYENKLFIFHPETNKTTEVEINYPPISAGQVTTVSSHMNTIYFSVHNHNESANKTIHKLDTTTMKWELVTVLINFSFLSKPRVFGNKLYFVQSNSSNIPRLAVVDLVENEAEYYILNGCMNNRPCFHQFTTINGLLYLMECGKSWDVRVVWIFEDGKLREISCEDMTNNVKKERTISGWENGRIFSEDKNSEINKHTYPANLYLNTFDPVKCEWSRIVIETEWCWPLSYPIRGIAELNDIIYTIDRPKRNTSVEFEIKLLDMKPNLSNTCMLQLIDGVIENEDNVDKILNLKRVMPFPLRSKISAISKWRIDRNEFKKQLRSQILAERKMEEEIILMMEEGVIDDKLADALRRNFKYL